MHSWFYSKANRNESVSKENITQQNTMKSNERSAAARNTTEKVFVNSENVQVALQSFINRHRSNLQKLTEQNSKLSQQNALLNAHLSNQQGNISALNEKWV